jgi:hypothetical protein
MRFYTTLKLGPNRELTREGFTVFRNVSVSRVGAQVYGPDEGTSIEPGPDGLIHIIRTPEEVFRRETLESANGKALVIYHPNDDVTPENWRDLSHGFMANARRGTGAQEDETVADIFVTSNEAVREIDLGMRELSLGYDADYFQTAPGRGEQRNIYVNHLALVPKGRCGSVCAVRDNARKEECAVMESPELIATRRFIDNCKAKRSSRDYGHSMLDDAELQHMLGGVERATHDPGASTGEDAVPVSLLAANRKRHSASTPVTAPTADQSFVAAVRAARASRGGR